ncbi:MAG TPA: OmpA family protein, partial [Cytophagales bacterium]|nr:OmpA family protein [Cytophagales bacterium]
PENVGIPLNSPYDDSYFVPVAGKYNQDEAGYLVSNRPGGIALHSETCCDDIYHFKEVPIKTVPFEGVVVENIYQKLDQKDTTALSDTTKLVVSSKKNVTETLLEVTKVAGVQVGYFRKKFYDDAVARKDSSFSSLEEFVTWADTTDAKGGYTFTLKEGKPYAILTKKQGYKNKVHFIIATATKTELNIEKKDKADTATIKIAQKIFTDKLQGSDVKTEEKYVLKQVKFETMSAILKKDALAELERLYQFLDNNKNVRIEIEGHTDSKGTEEYNLDLSQRRAEAIVQYLIAKGMEERRMTSKGFGESMPLVPNENADGSDNPENRALNRRTEFKIINTK